MQRILKFLLAALLAAPVLGNAQSRIPSLDQDDRRGEIGRAAHQRAVERFDHADADKDGLLSRDEVAAAGFDYIVAKFDEMDKDGDGFLSWEEFIGHDRWQKE